MSHAELFKISLSALSSNKLRAALTMLGILFGTAAVIAMMSISEGAKQETLKQIELMGTNNLIVRRSVLSRDMNSSHAMFSPGLTLHDAGSVMELVPGVEYVTPEREINSKLQYKSSILDMKIIGTTPEFPQTFNCQIAEGRFFKSFHLSSYANVCVIGSAIKDKLFKFENPINKKVKIGSLWFNIIGVMSPKNITSTVTGPVFDKFNEDIYIPINTLMYKLEQKSDITSNTGVFYSGMVEPVNAIDRNSIDQFTVKVKSSNKAKLTAYLINKILVRKHFGIKDYVVFLPEALLAQKQKTQRIFNIVMGAIAGISLLVGGIGIMNIMLANILERTKEIGVRRAVGATKFDVINQFICEALIISIAGGLVGILAGFILTSFISAYAEWKTIITPFSIALAFMVSVVTGLSFGIYPAKKAATQNPIESLRYE